MYNMYNSRNVVTPTFTGAASEDELRTVFRLHGQTTGKVTTIIIITTITLF